VRRRAGLVGGIAGAVAVGAAVGLAAERYAVGRARLAPDPEAGERFFELPADRVRSVRTDDGLTLHVEEVGPETAPLTVVFCHGYTMQMACWHYQRKAFAAEPPGKVVFWDHRSHGRSQRAPKHSSTIEQLGRDLHAVLDACAPTGKVVLVGHSMGGMTIMALADQCPELFGERIVGVALVATSTGKLAEVTFGLPALFSGVNKRVLPYLTRGMQSRPAVFERGRRLGTDLAFVGARRVGFGPEASPAQVEFTERMIAATPSDVIADFYGTLIDHDKLAALPVLKKVETLVLVGSADVITPPDHSRTIAQQLPDAQLVVVEGAGHMVMMERHALVNLQLRALFRRAAGARRRTA